MADSNSRFRNPKSKDEKAMWFEQCIRKNTRNKTKLSKTKFEEWQRKRQDKIAKNESFGFECKNVEEVQDLTVNISENMSALSLNIWLTKFVGEVVNHSGGSIHQDRYTLLCVVSEESVNILAKGDRR